jgi:hypothetical protein
MIDALLHPDMGSFIEGLALGFALGVCVCGLLSIRARAKEEVWPHPAPTEHVVTTPENLLEFVRRGPK